MHTRVSGRSRDKLSGRPDGEFGRLRDRSSLGDRTRRLGLSLDLRVGPLCHGEHEGRRSRLSRRDCLR
jgi:hypothetical protein